MSVQRWVMCLSLSVSLCLPAGCGTSKAEIRTAQRSAYDADFPIVFSHALAAVTELYPNLVENPSAGWIKTAWHPLKITNDGQTSDDPLGREDQPQPGNANNPFSATNYQRKRYFVRFRVFVVGGKPWRVRVEGEASVWEAGAVPTPLRGAETPHWLKGRVEALQVEIHRRLDKYAVQPKNEPPPAPIEAPVDVTRFGDLPPGAAETVAAVHAAAAAGDLDTLRQLMHDQFVWSHGSEPNADQALAMWRADATVVARLAAAVDAGCAPTADGARVECPAGSGAPGHVGDRATFERVGSEWQLVSFLAGD